MEGFSGNSYPDVLYNGRAQGLRRCARPVEGGAGGVSLSLGEGEEQMLAAQIAVTKAQSLLLGLTENSSGGGCEQAFSHGRSPHKKFFF
jgi:hypothetical protein